MKKILVVDDESGIRRLLRKALERSGYQVSEAADGASAVELFRFEVPDLILLDIDMPGMDGVEALAGIRKIDSRVPVIMVTGSGDLQRAEQTMMLGANDYLEKPIDFEALRLSIASNLAAR